jgi:putative restriction endonuclease
MACFDIGDRGANPNHIDNVGLRIAMQRQVPLIYFHGVVPGLYVAEWPVYVVGDDPPSLTFTVSVDDRRFASLGSVGPLESEEADIRRRYATRLFQQRLHQREFRERVVRAYQHHCAVCRLRRDELLEAAHILPDTNPLGVPTVPNGLALCALHHAAFDAHLIGIRADYVVQVRKDVLDEKDGPMLIHGLQGFHGAGLLVPRRPASQPGCSKSDTHGFVDSPDNHRSRVEAPSRGRNHSGLRYELQYSEEICSTSRAFLPALSVPL